MMNQFELTLGLPHTNHLGLAEHLLLQWAVAQREQHRPHAPASSL